MKGILLYGVLLAGVFPAVSSGADERVSFGLGMSALYNGLGVNAAFMKGSDLKYVSLGCVSIAYSSNSGASSNCGVGVGWMRSDILSNNGKHGLGVHLGITYNSHDDRDDVEVFVGVPYAYFFSGMTAASWHVGLTPVLGRRDDDTEGGLLVNLGYQF